MNPARMNGQIGFALALLVLATVYASQIPQLGMPFAKGGEPGASLMPLVLCAILIVGAIRVIIGELRQIRQADPQPLPQSDHLPGIAIIGPIAVILCTGLFAAGLQIVGYFVSAGLYSFAIALYFNYEETGQALRAIGMSLITAAAITVFGWLFFVTLFGLSLPGWSL